MKEIEVYNLIKKYDFQYTISYDYDRVLATEHDTYCANDYCRCSTIENCIITNININLFVEHIKDVLYIDIENKYFDKHIEKFCKDLKTEDFFFDISGGYYGEELISIHLEDHVANKLANIFGIKFDRREKLRKLLSENDEKCEFLISDDVKKILTDEYGYVLDSLKNSKFKIIDINTSDIIFPQKEYNDFIKTKKLSGYKNEKNICGLVKKINDKYHVIDGYHRINANIDKKTIKVVLAY